MAKKRSAKRPAAPRASRRSGYRVTLRTPGGGRLTLRLHGNEFHRETVRWNVWLVSTQLRNNVPKPERRRQARDLLKKVSRAGGISEQRMNAFLHRAAQDGIVQVETDWEGFSAPDTDRLFPWEETLALACRDAAGGAAQRFLVVRWLTRKTLVAPTASGPAAIIVSRDAAAAFGTDSEARVVRRSLGESVRDSLDTVGSLDELRRCLRPQGNDPPRIIHWMLRSVDKGIVFDADDLTLSLDGPPAPGSRGPRALSSDQDVAEVLAAHRPALVGLSSCYTGRRLAPLVIGAGADLAIGIHHEAEDANLPAFFATFYAAWLAGADPIGALRRALAFNRDQPDHDALGAVTLWSAHDLFVAPPKPPKGAPPPSAPTTKVVVAAPHEGLVFDCEPEPALNYSVLHCSRGGLFRRFIVTALDRPPTDPLDISVRLDSGSDTAAECRFIMPAPAVPNARIDVAAAVSLPLGGALLRQRRETLKGSIEVTVGAGGRTLFRKTWGVDLLTCDEWRDDFSGNHFLPSFVLPRDPAVGEILTHAQGLLRGITDNYQAAFRGYAVDARQQVQALWASLTDHFRIDYIISPPANRRSCQRLRTPEEMLRYRRGNCIDLALLFASCWECIHLDPVLFLMRNHSLCGYWASGEARQKFFDSLERHALDDSSFVSNTPLGGTVAKRSGSTPWNLTEHFQFAAIRAAIQEKAMVPVQATCTASRASLQKAIDNGTSAIDLALKEDDFDAMLDVRTARELGVTPLPILTDSPVA